MERLEKLNINFIVAAVSSLIIILMIAYMLVNVNAFFIRILMILEFICDFYLVTVFFYRIKKYNRFEIIFFIFVAIMPFMVSILNMFYVFNFFSLTRVFLKNPLISGFLTRGYHFLFLFYITHIIYFFYLFALENKKTFSSLTISIFCIFSSATLAVIFIILYAILYSIYSDKMITTYKSSESSILYEADNIFYKDKSLEDIDYMGFAESYGMSVFYYDNELKYKSEDWQLFSKYNLLFETSIIQGNGFFFMGSGKIFAAPFYIFLLIYTIVLSFILTSFIFFLRFFLYKNFESYASIIIKGFSEENYMYAIDTDSMEESELKTISKLYNDKLLPYKYRERYMKMLIK